MKAASKSGTDGEGEEGRSVQRACRGKERERGKVLNEEEEEEMEVDEGVRRAREETWRSGTSDY